MTIPNPTEAPMANATDDVKLESVGPITLCEEVERSRTTLLRYCYEAQAGRYPADAREFERRADAAFRSIRAMLAAAPPPPAPSQHAGWSDEAVEAAARAIDPDRFKFWQSSYDYEMAQVGDADEARKFADWCHKLEPIRVAARAALTAASSIAPATGFAVKDDSPTVVIGYTNWRGEYAEREVVPIHPWFGSTDWHPEPQWLLKAWDVSKNAERDFAIKDIGIRSCISPSVPKESGEP